MRLGFVVTGALAVAVGVGILRLARTGLGRLDLAESERDAIRLFVAMTAGLLITVGALTILAGLLV